MRKEGEPRNQKVETPVFSSWEDIDRVIRLGIERKRLGVRGQAISFLEELEVRKVKLEVLESLVSKGSLPPYRLGEYRTLFELFASTPDRNPPLKREIGKIRKEEEAVIRAEARKRTEAKAKRVRKERRRAKREKAKTVKKKEAVKKKEPRLVTYEFPDGKKVRGKVGRVLKELAELGDVMTSDDLALHTGFSRDEVVKLVGYARNNILPGTGTEIVSVFDPEVRNRVGQKVAYLFSTPEGRGEIPVGTTPESALGESAELPKPKGMEN